MFNVRRYDPSQGVQSTGNSNGHTVPEETSRQQLSLLHDKIASRQRQRQAQQAPEPSVAATKRTADQAFNQEPSAPKDEEQGIGPTGWKPAPGESPAEREKRIKREKRAAALLAAQGSSQEAVPPKKVSFSEDRNQVKLIEPVVDHEDQETGAAAATVHPSRAGLVPLKKATNAQALTPARKRYLKKKKERSKAKKKAARQDTSSVNGDDDDKSGSSGSSSDSDQDDEEKRKKLEVIRQKKEERRRKRLEKKAIARAIKNGEPVPTFDPAPTSSSNGNVEEHEKTASPEPQPKPERKKSKKGKEPEEQQSVDPPAIESQAEPVYSKREAKELKKAHKYIPPTTEDLIPTAPGPLPQAATDSDESEYDESSEGADKTEGAPLLQLPAPAKRVKTNAVLPVHEAVRNRLVIAPSTTVSLSDDKNLATLCLSTRARDRLSNMGIKTAFAVQTSVWPILMEPRALAPTRTCRPQRDLCVAAPTGSGKTLAYVVPIVEALRNRLVTRVRALVILPTRDLVNQVRDTFETFGKGSGLRVGTATGANSFAQEQSSILGDLTDPKDPTTSAVDILVCTPGRLMDHLRSSANGRFSLQHLEFLVVDEADRLMGQSFQEWLPSILDAVNPLVAAKKFAEQLDVKSENHSVIMASNWLNAVRPLECEFAPPVLSTCRKMLFSATLSRDPAKIDALKLNRPIFVAVEDESNDAQQAAEDFTFPETLSEHVVVTPAANKPLYLLHLLHSNDIASALCFTRSVDAAGRLARLVDFFEDEHARAHGDESRKTIKTFSSDLAPAERKRLLAAFKRGEIHMLICSDIIARGIDLPSVSHVISYDVPTDLRSYVHRVGRTARAGKRGDAWSFVEDQEVAPFKKMMRTADDHWSKIQRVKVKDRQVEPLVPLYERALEQYKKYLNKEA